MAAPRQTPAGSSAEGIATRVRRAVVMAGWLALLIGGLIGLLQAQPNLPEAGLGIALAPTATGLVGMAILGVLVGAFTGLWLWGSRGMLRLAVATFAVVAGMIASELTRALILHITPREALTMLPDGIEAAMIGLGILGAMIGIRAGRAKPADLAALIPQPAAAQAAAPPRRRQRSNTARPAEAPRRPRLGERLRGGLAALQSWSQQPEAAPQPVRQRPASAARRRTRQSAPRVNGSTPAQETPARRIEISPRAVSIPKKARKKGRLFGRKNVQLGKTITSVCPYCLEEVTRNDPRGRVVCEICGTPHHADCWAITGKCEVPHLQT